LIAVRDLPFVVRDMEGRLVLSPARLRIEELKAAIGTGSVRATGEVALDGGAVGAYQVALSAQRVGLTPVEGLETVWNSELALVGRGARGLVRGEAHLVRGTYTRDLSILPLLLKTGGRAEPAEWGRELAPEPPMSQEDLLALVTVGATKSELGSSGGGTVFATEAAQLISKELLGGELNAPTVDILEFGKNEAGQSEFRVGKRLNDRTLV